MDFFASRIVSLQPSATVILERIGAASRLIACAKYCEEVVPGIAHGRTILADSWTAKADEIVAAKPDLVIAAVPYQAEAVAQILKSGARFLGLAPRTLADIYGDIATIAGAVGVPERGSELIATMQQAIAAARRHARTTGQRPRVFCEEWGKPIIASQPWVAELVEAAGGEFVTAPGKQTTAEAVSAADPDILIAAWCGAGNRVPLEKVVADRGWQQMRAVRKRQVYCIPDPCLNTPAPTLLSGLAAIEAILRGSAADAPAGVRRLGETAGK